MVKTTVVGSYPRIGDAFEEQALRRGLARLDRGEITEADLRAVERDTVKTVLKEQNEVGIDLVTDGQISWYDSQSHIAGKLASIEINGLVRYFDTNTYYRQPVVRGAVSRNGPLLVDEWKFAQGSSKAPVKAVLTGPVTLASLSLDKHYGNKKALAGAFASAIGEEVGALVKAGASQIQIDEPILTQHPEDLSLVSEGLDRIRGHKAKATLTLFTFFGDVAGIYKDLQEVPADILGLDLVQGAATWPVLAKHGSSKPLGLGVVDAPNTDAEEPGRSDPRPHQSREGGTRLGRAAGPGAESDPRVDPVPGGNRHRHPRRRGTVPGRHGDVLRRKPRRDGDFRPGPFVREPLLQE